MADQKPKLEAPRDSRPSARAWFRVGLGLILVSAVVGASMSIRDRVEQRQQWDEGEWNFALRELPSYIPRGFRGELVELRELPSRVSLASPSWRESLESELLSNPWVDAVRKLERGEDRQIDFSVRFRRPVVALRTREGYLLVDSRGMVLDSQPGADLASEWQIPFCELGSGLPEPVLPGQYLQSVELQELLALVRALRELHVLPRYLERVPELVSVPESQAGTSFLWTLVLANGAQLVWGRSPGGENESPLELEEKRQNFLACMEDYSLLRGGTRISLCRRTVPIVE